MNRRHFLATSALAAMPLSAQTKQNAHTPKIISFTKSFIDLSFEDSAALVAEVGWDGVDIPVRKETPHIHAERAADDLPRFLAALKKHGKDTVIITSDITRITPSNEKLLRTLAANGIKKYRLGFLRYNAKDHPMKVAREHTATFKDIAALNKELGLWAGYQNHSGNDYFGGPIWDVMLSMQDTDEQQLGLCFDIAHATVEGGQNWPIQYRLARPRIGVAYIKDYRWREANKQWHRDACHFGEGIVRKNYFQQLLASGFTGEFCQHHEYPLGTGAERISHYKKDLATLKSHLKD